MTEFSFDTSGFVPRSRGFAGGDPGCGLLAPVACYWPDLSPFVQGYVEALASSSSALKTEWLLHMPSGENRVLGFSDLDPSALALILRDCEAFHTRYGDWPKRAHGVGFWEGRQRRNHAPHFEPLQPYLSDEGRVCLREAA